MKKLLAFTVVAALFCACNNVEKDADGFPKAEKIAADSIAINEILRPDYGNSYAIVGDNILISSISSSKILFRYSLPDWTFIDTTFTKGVGPEDFNLPVFISSSLPSSTNMWVSDINKSEIKCLDVSKEKVSIQKNISFKNNKKRPGLWDCNIIDNRYILANNFDFQGTKRNLIKIYDIKDSLVVNDSITDLSVWEIKTFGSGNRIGVRPLIPSSVKTYGNTMFVAYPTIGSTEIYKITDEGKLLKEKTLGNVYTYEQLVAMSENAKNDKTINSFLAASEKYLYFLFGTTKEEPNPNSKDTEHPTIDKQNSTEIRIYDHEMNPVKKIILDKICDEVIIDEAHKKIYAWNSRLDFEQVYIFDLKI